MGRMTLERNDWAAEGVARGILAVLVVETFSGELCGRVVRDGLSAGCSGIISECGTYKVVKDRIGQWFGTVVDFDTGYRFARARTLATG
jgi:hypothetical protein